jgi:hypothetical protein
MKTHFRILILIFCTACSTKHVEGLYKTKFKETGIVDQHIEINCDGSAYLFQRPSQTNDTIKAKWIQLHDTLQITFDSVRFQRESSEKLLFKVKRNRLIAVAFSKTEFEKEINKMKAEGVFDLKKYPMFESVKTYNDFAIKVPVDFKNSWRNQYYEKQNKSVCK